LADIGIAILKNLPVTNGTKTGENKI